MNASDLSPLLADLQEHLAVCREVASVIESENQALRRSESRCTSEYFQKKNLLPALNQSLNRIRQHRVEWCRRSPSERARATQVSPLLREIQDLIMKTIVLDRENEQALLRKGLIPARHLPPANRQRPHYVAELYRRQTETVEASSQPPEGPA